jgi:hypothetical protein
MPSLQYALCAVELSPPKKAELHACWNLVHWFIFNYRKYDSVSNILCGLGKLDFEHLHTWWTLNFKKNCCYSQNVVCRYLCTLFTISGEFKQLCSVIDVVAWCFSYSSFGANRDAVYDHSVLLLSVKNALFICFHAHDSCLCLPVNFLSVVANERIYYNRLRD